MHTVWIFSSVKGRFPGGVFTNYELAKEWIEKNKLTGVLTEFPLDEGVYDWAITNNLFEVKKDDQKTSDFIGSFTSASQEHVHFENGKEE